ncbi:MAG: DEAD/DEAH box helicase [Breznakibacter sp.]|nr:DEAD/DEAH box helicase [Breznakibacter sp.]
MQKLSHTIKDGLGRMGIHKLNAMQESALLSVEKHPDVVLLSPTGSGKTLAFMLPILNMLDPENKNIQALIIAPSRELAIQIEQVFKQLGTGFKVNCCYGGHPFKTEVNNLTHPPALLVGTPGRIADHLRRNSFDAIGIRTLVLDEFDKALDLGFMREMKEIIEQLPRIRRRILTSATPMDEIPTFTGIHNPVVLDYLEKDVQPNRLTVKGVRSEGRDKLDAFIRLISHLGNAPMLVFVNHRESADRISTQLFAKGIAHGIFHGGMKQEERERALITFRNGSHHLLVTTDLASRGLDIPDIQYIIHYHLPTTAEAYIHRNGRTARMKASGTAYLLLAEGESIPEYIGEEPVWEELPVQGDLPEPADWVTLYIGSGKKDKVNKVDIVGLFLQKGKLKKDELGLIDVLDYSAFVAIRSNKVKKVLELLKEEKIKGKKLKIELSR